MTDQLKDKVRGCLVGTAIGDALGMPSEIKTRSEILSIFGPKGITDFEDSQSKFSRDLKKGQWTDDTKLTLATAEGFLDAFENTSFKKAFSEGMFLTDVLREKVLLRYLAAIQEHNRGFGKTTTNSLKDRAKGIDPFDGRNPKRPGNGCAMKAGAIGAFAEIVRHSFGSRFSDVFADLAIEIGMLTHNDSRSLAASGVQMEAVRCAFGDQNLQSPAFVRLILAKAYFYEEKLKLLGLDDGPQKISGVLAKALSLSGASDELIADTIKTSGAAYESFPTALMYAVKYQDDFSNAVLAGANAGGDTDTIAAMTGAVVGARLGYQEIPKTWRTRIEDHDYILKVADNLVDSVAKAAGRPA